MDKNEIITILLAINIFLILLCISRKIKESFRDTIQVDAVNKIKNAPEGEEVNTVLGTFVDMSEKIRDYQNMFVTADCYAKVKDVDGKKEYMLCNAGGATSNLLMAVNLTKELQDELRS